MARGAVVDIADPAEETDTELETVETTEEESPETPSFQEAFEAAKKSHAEAEEPAADDDDEAEPAPKARVGRAQRATEAAAPAKDETGLLTDAEFTALQTKHANDPLALRKSLEGAFTKKTQALAEQRRSQERLAPYAEMIDALESDPDGTIRALAEQHGITIGRAEPAAETAETAAAATEAVLTEFRTALGPELEYLADGLAPAITKLVERLTATTVEKATAPQRQQLEQLTGRAAVEQTDVVMKAFEGRHPDWKTHEPELLALSQKLSPKGMTEGEYLDHLYTIVTANALPAAIDTKVAEGVKKALKRMADGAETTETRTRSTPERAVRIAPPENPTFHEAYQAAKRGERWE